jgi:hypothetical protein
MPESLEEFRRSFFYGSRSDMSFKFLKSMSDEAATEFIRRLFREIGGAYDTGDVGPIVRLVYETEVAAYTPRPETEPRWRYDDRPFTPLRRPLRESKLGLLTSSGHFVAGDDPEPFGVKDMSQQEAEDRITDFLRAPPTLSAIPRDTPSANLAVRHGGYDVRSVRHDPNVTFPRDRLVEAEAAGRIGSLAATLYSFTGAAAQGRVKRAADEWAATLHRDHVDAILLVPV